VGRSGVGPAATNQNASGQHGTNADDRQLLHVRAREGKAGGRTGLAASRGGSREHRSAVTRRGGNGRRRARGVAPRVRSACDARHHDQRCQCESRTDNQSSCPHRLYPSFRGGRASALPKNRSAGDACGVLCSVHLAWSRHHLATSDPRQFTDHHCTCSSPFVQWYSVTRDRRIPLDRSGRPRPVRRTGVRPEPAGRTCCTDRRPR
jgi:hypothetical protein